MIKKLFLLAIFLTTALFSGLNDSIYAQTPNAVELERLNQEQIKNIIQVNSEEEFTWIILLILLFIQNNTVHYQTNQRKQLKVLLIVQ